MEIDIEQIIDRVIKSSADVRNNHQIERENIDANQYSDVDNEMRANIKYPDPVKQRQQ